jgi:hypothetical protein
MASVSFGDNVRISPTPETEAKGIAGLHSVVYGETTPSVTGVDVVGKLEADYAVNVYFENLNESFWFTPALVEFIDHGAGQEITIKCVPKKLVRTASGEWLEQSTAKPWWKFWRDA